jgi:hypothetical protein
MFQLPSNSESSKVRTNSKFFGQFTFLTFLLAMISYSCKEKHQDIKVIYWHQGQETVLSSNLSEFMNLIKTSENLLLTADDMLKLIVDPELIQKIKKDESAIEIIYSKPVELTSNYNKETIHPDRILIPLSGEFVGKDENPPATIFHGYPEYSAGPYRNHKGFGELKKILYHMGIK